VGSAFNSCHSWRGKKERQKGTRGDSITWDADDACGCSSAFILYLIVPGCLWVLSITNHCHHFHHDMWWLSILAVFVRYYNNNYFLKYFLFLNILIFLKKLINFWYYRIKTWYKILNFFKNIFKTQKQTYSYTTTQSHFATIAIKHG